MPWKIKNAVGDTLAESHGFFSLPLRDYFPHSGFSEAVTNDLEFSFELDGITVSWEHPAPVVPQPETIEQAIKRLDRAVEDHLNQTARNIPPYGYDSFDKAMGYIGDPVPQWNAEARALQAYRSSIWLVCINTIQQVSLGNRAIPTNDEFLSELPIYINPVL